MQRTEIRILVEPINSVSLDDAAGKYIVRVPSSLNESEIADTAIESFHRAIPLARPEDYEITIIDAKGYELTPTYGEVGAVFDCNQIQGL